MTNEPNSPKLLALPEGVQLRVVGPLVAPLNQASLVPLAIRLDGRWDWTHSNTPNWHATNTSFSGALFSDPDGSWELNGLAYYTNGQSQPYGLRFSAASNSLLWHARESFTQGFEAVTSTNELVRVTNNLRQGVSVTVRRRFAFQNTFFVLEAGSYIVATAG